MTAVWNPNGAVWNPNGGSFNPELVDRIERDQVTEEMVDKAIRHHPNCTGMEIAGGVQKPLTLVRRKLQELVSLREIGRQTDLGFGNFENHYLAEIHADA